MSNKVLIINQDILNTLHTGTLLSRRKALLKCEESFSLSDQQNEQEPNPRETGFIEFKDTVEWQQAYDNLKNILSKREHRQRK